MLGTLLKVMLYVLQGTSWSQWTNWEQPPTPPPKGRFEGLRVALSRHGIKVSWFGRMFEMTHRPLLEHQTKLDRLV